MPSVFSRIIDGELPATFVWRDDRCVGFLSIQPLRPGHTLVVPRREVDHWIDVDPDEWAHVTSVAQTVGKALQAAYSPAKVGLMLAGLEVPHTHLHVVPIDGVHDLDFANADPDPEPSALEAAAERIRAALRDLSAEGVADR
ncbi:MAG: HIT family protein [Actinomycetota bacterium]|nr:HIT family protein [Actinomycetota bacterium]